MTGNEDMMKEIGQGLPAGILLLGFLASAATKSVDLSGTWVLEETEQSFSPISAGPAHGGGGYPGVGMPGGPVYPGGAGRGRGGNGGYPGEENPAPGTIPLEAGRLTLVIRQTPTEVKVERRWSGGGKEQSVVQAFALNGGENLNPDDSGKGEVTSKARWQKNTLVAEGAQRISTGKRNIEMPVKQEFSLSKDRSSLTIKTTMLTPAGLMSTKQVFRKF